LARERRGRLGTSAVELNIIELFNAAGGWLGAAEEFSKTKGGKTKPLGIKIQENGNKSKAGGSNFQGPFTMLINWLSQEYGASKIPSRLHLIFNKRTTGYRRLLTGADGYPIR
jgi:hypothetical protein